MFKHWILSFFSVYLIPLFCILFILLVLPLKNLVPDPYNSIVVAILLLYLIWKYILWLIEEL